MKKASILTVLMIFALLGGLVYVLSSPILFLCASLGAVGGIYLIGSSLLLRKSSGEALASYSIPLLLLSIILPIVLTVFQLYWGIFAPLTVLLSTSLALVFFHYLFMIPLALYHKHLEQFREVSTPLPPVSILIPAYNEEGYVGRTIESLLETQYPEAKKEIIVIDDGSTDNTYYEAKQYESEGVKVLHKKNGGKYSALNYGLYFTTGDIVFTVDADSIVARKAVRRLVSRFQKEDGVGGVAGSVKVLNRGTFLTNCQAMEYILGINIFRRALDFLGSVSVVPGCLGGFKKQVLEQVGFYDPNTLTEDFDTTVKVLKLGKAIKASSGAKVYTEVPVTLRDLYNQRLRWYRGNLMTVFKHKNALFESSFGFLNKIAFPFFLFSMIFIPFARILVLASLILGLLSGMWFELLTLFLFFLLLQVLISLLGIQMEEEDIKLIAFAPFLMIGYNHFLDFITLKSLFDVLFSDELQWTQARRVEKIEARKRKQVPKSKSHTD